MCSTCPLLLTLGSVLGLERRVRRARRVTSAHRAQWCFAHIYVRAGAAAAGGQRHLSTVNRPLRVQSRLPFPILVWFSLAAVDFVKDAFFVSYDCAYILHGCMKLY